MSRSWPFVCPALVVAVRFLRNQARVLAFQMAVFQDSRTSLPLRLPFRNRSPLRCE